MTSSSLPSNLSSMRRVCVCTCACVYAHLCVQGKHIQPGEGACMYVCVKEDAWVGEWAQRDPGRYPLSPNLLPESFGTNS